MNFELTQEEKMWQKVVNDFMDKEVGREYVRQCDLEGRYPEELYKRAAELGWLGLMLPEKYGGSGADIMMYCLYCEAISKWGQDMFNVMAGPMFVVRRVENYGSEEQKDYYLPRFCRGEIRISFSLTESEAGSDAASLTTSAVADGDCFVINGEKQFSTAAHLKGNIILLAARTDKTAPKHQGISIMLVPNDLPGIEIVKLPAIVYDIAGTTEIFFNDVRIPKDNLIGELNQGWRYLIEHLDEERVGEAASVVGMSQTVLDDAIAYAKQRVQFGKPIAQFQVINHMLVDMQVELSCARLLTYELAWKLSRGMRAHKEAAIAKLYASEACHRIADSGMRILGGYSFLPETDMERYWRESMLMVIGAGTSQIQRNIIAREMGLLR